MVKVSESSILNVFTMRSSVIFLLNYKSYAEWTTPVWIFGIDQSLLYNAHLHRDVSASSLSLISVVIIGSSEVWLRLGIHLGLETLSHGS